MAMCSKKWNLWRLILCSMFVVGLLATFIQDVNADDQDVPSESQCRPYIEKALKDLEAGETHTEDADSKEQGDSGSQEDNKEDAADEDSSVEILNEDGDDSGQTEEQNDEPSVEVADEPYVDGEANDDSESAPGDSKEDSGEKTPDNDDDSNESAEKQEADDGEKSEEGDSKEDGQQQGDSNEASAEDNKTDEDDADGTASVETQEDDKEDSENKSDESGEKPEDGEVSKEEQDEDVSNKRVKRDLGEQPEEQSNEEGDSKEVDDDDSKEKSEADSKEDSKEDEKASNEEAENLKQQSDDDSKETAEDKDDVSKEVDGDKDDDSKESDNKDDDSKEEVDKKDDDSQEKSEEASKEKDDDSKETAEEKDDSQETTENKDDSKETVEDKDSKETVEEKDSKETVEDKDSKETDEEKGSKETDDKSEESTEKEQGDSPSEETEHPEEDLLMERDIPENLRPKEHITQILRLGDESTEGELLIEKSADIILRELKRLYDNAIKPLEILYKYRDLSNRHFGDPEIFSKPLILFMGPWSGGKSSLINYLTDNEFTEWSLRTGAEPSPAYFNILMHGKEPQVLDGTQLAADWTFSGLQKFGQGLEERLRGLKYPSKLLEKVNIVEIPGILEVRKQVSRVFPFNDACQWFIDRADIIFLVYDPSKLDVGPETEAILDQLKGRESQTRIILNKADQVKPEELMRVQSALIWNISPLMSSAQPPVMYTTSLWSLPYEAGAPIRLLQAQERVFLKDLREAIDKRVDNKIASARRFAVRVRNHAKMVDCYLTTYYNHKTIFANKKVVAEAIIEHPQNYHIYEGLSTLTNISRYDLPDPETYRDFFRLNALYDFQQLSATCTYFRGCPINRLDIAIAYDLPELVGKYKKMVESATPQGMPKS